MRPIPAWYQPATLSLLLSCVLAASCDDVQQISVGFAESCEEDADCDDGVYCNGPERCERVMAESGGATDSGGVCRRATARCGEGEVCVEEEQICLPRDCYGSAGDRDGDGFDRIACGGDDCDDDDAARFPGRAEVCDAEHHDEDCDPSTFGVRDSDRDGFASAECCNIDADGTPLCGVDCDDERPGVHPVAVEACNEQDDDCDGASDEGVLVPLFPDLDGDGHGDASAVENLCAGSPGYASLSNDCDDGNPAIQPGAMRCVGGQVPGEVMVCSEEGSWEKSSCGGQLVCVTQPNATGICR